MTTSEHITELKNNIASTKEQIAVYKNRLEQGNPTYESSDGTYVATLDEIIEEAELLLDSYESELHDLEI
ncbi:MAG: hypothetical protein RSC68_15965 [Acinetobacter sp.]